MIKQSKKKAKIRLRKQRGGQKDQRWKVVTDVEEGKLKRYYRNEEEERVIEKQSKGEKTFMQRRDRQMKNDADGVK